MDPIAVACLAVGLAAALLLDRWVRPRVSQGGLMDKNGVRHDGRVRAKIEFVFAAPCFTSKVCKDQDEEDMLQELGEDFTDYVISEIQKALAPSGIGVADLDVLSCDVAPLEGE